MDPRIKLLKDFSRGLVPGTVKIETERYGFEYLAQLLAGGVSLEYGELTPTRLLHKYKLTNVTESRMDAFLGDHINKESNVCRYFDGVANDVFCFNLDNNHKTNNTVVITEMQLAVRALETCLKDLDCEPLIIASGRGYHVWCRLDHPVENEQLSTFMLRVAVRALLTFHGSGYDHNTVKFNFYPDVKIHNVVSLRLFGSVHAKNKTFSQILATDGLLDEAESWKAFEAFLRTKTIPITRFAAAFERLASLF